ncbi:MAG: hypothetical protein ACQGVC_02510 [Myxococcota bacterium]
MRWLDALVFSSLWVAATAAALCRASAPAMGAAPDAAVVGLAFCGTLLVYNVDRLRDLARDRVTSPARSRFVEEHRGALLGLSVAAGAGSAGLAFAVGPTGIAALLPIALLGFFHRRLKRFGWWKPFYVSAAWCGVTVGLPAVTAAAPRHVTWVAAIVAITLAGNVIASNLRDGEAWSVRFGARVPLRVARGCAALGLLLAGLAPPPVRPLAAIPGATLLALLFFRPDERYGLVVVDGALLVGALSALPWYAA